MKKIVVVGSSGMLGGMLSRYLEAVARNDIAVVGTQRANCADQNYLAIRDDMSFDCHKGLFSGASFIVNCVAENGLDKLSGGAYERGWYVNAQLPHRLCDVASKMGARLIHISTDAVFASGAYKRLEGDSTDGTGAYAESKREGETRAAGALTIRTSIFGPELSHYRHLLSWLQSKQPGDEIRGYTNHIWSGVTTYQVAQLIRRIASCGLFDDLFDEGHVLHYCSEAISKYELLCGLNQIYDLQLDIRPVLANVGVTRILASSHSARYGNEDLLAKAAEAREFWNKIQH